MMARRGLRLKLYLVSEVAKFPKQFGRPFLDSSRVGSVPKLDVPDTLMQNLPGQPAEAMGYRPNRFVVS